MRVLSAAATGLLAALLLHRPALARTVPVDSTAGLIAAVVGARPGDDIVLADGTYVLPGDHGGSHGVDCLAAGTAAAPITVRAARPLGARIESSAVEAFAVGAPYWHFDGLDIRGVCPDDSRCEHAFHVVGRAVGFAMRGNRVADFNAQLKVNAAGDDHALPDDGLVEGNLFLDTHPRRTANPVTPVNIDNAAGWVVRANLIRNFHKAGGDGVSYGAYAKGGARGPVFERNLVLCATGEESGEGGGGGGERIGLSFGGGGMAPALCAPAWSGAAPCDPEVEGGVMRNNVVADCSDVGVYLNRARDTRLLYNTLVATGGVVFRFAGSTGEAVGNVLASSIRTRQGGSVTMADNLADLSPGQFRAWFRDPTQGDLRRSGDPGLLAGKGTPRPDLADDFCGRPREGRPDLGAVQLSAGGCALDWPLTDLPR
jgi:hypothetical protein